MLWYLHSLVALNMIYYIIIIYYSFYFSFRQNGIEFKLVVGID